MSTQQKSYGLPIAMMFALFFMISFVTGFSNPMGIIVKNQFDVNNFMSQLGNFANFLAYAFMGIPAGILIQKKGYKTTALLAIIVGFVGVGIQFLSGAAGSFPVYLIGAFVAGFSMCMLNAVVNPMLNTLGGGGKKGNQLIQFGGSINSIGATIVPVLVGYLIGGSVNNASIKDANPALFIAMGIFALAFIVLYAVNIPEPHMATGEKTATKHSHSPLSFRHFKLGAIAIFAYVGVEVGIANITNLFLTTKTSEQLAEFKAEYNKQQSDATYLAQLNMNYEVAQAELKNAETNASNDKDSNKKTKELRKKVNEEKSKIISKADYEKALNTKASGFGMDTAAAGSVVAIYWLLMLVGRLSGASLGARFSSKTMLIFVSSLGMILVLIAIFTPLSSTITMPGLKTGEDGTGISFGMTLVPVSIMFLVLCGLCTSVMWGGIFNLAVEGLGKYVPAASGIFMVMVCGGGVLPLIQGQVVDMSGFMASFWVIFIAIAYMLYYALVGSKNVNTDIPVN